MQYTVPLSFNPVEVTELTEILFHYRERPHNQVVADFEKALCQVTGSPYAVALNSGTSAIHLALKVMGVRAGDYVIVPSFTYVATVNPVLYLGAIPVFVDVDEQTGNMHPELLESALKYLVRQKKRAGAIIVVHTYGMPAPVDSLLQIATSYGVPVLEDAAESLGSRWDGVMTGTLAPIGIYSFNNNKIVTTYGGGAVVTRNADQADYIRFLSGHARENKEHYEHREVGFNYRMGVLNAAYGLISLKKLDEEVNRRRQLFEEYKSRLNHMAFFGEEQVNAASNRWLTTCLLPSEKDRTLWKELLKSHGIESRYYWMPMHLQPLYRDYPSFLNGKAEMLFKRGLCLPSGRDVSVETVEKIKSIIL